LGRCESVPVEQTVPSPTPPSGPLPRISRPEPSPSACPRNGLRSVGLGGSCPNRNGESLFAVPGGGPLSAAKKADVLANLRTHITTLERGVHQPQTTDQHQVSDAWTLGAAEIDQRLGKGLDPYALHEVKAAPREAGVAAGDWAAALGFAMRM